MRMFTIGHSTRPLDQFVALLRENGVRQLADVRAVPRSRWNPQFNLERLRLALREVGVTYLPMPQLGGRRSGRAGSANRGLRNADFRAFADYMQTRDFVDALDELLDAAAQAPTVIMCAEARPADCHRQFIADALLARGVEVAHILGPGRCLPHTLSEAAVPEGGTVTYPSIQQKSNRELI
ncbi:MAG TPA: DUF488 domain-containing protein [Candidatus Binatia bacterium]|nr:DUF488 domain-containing protein [Candidatus Binatia bacterium]